MPYENEHAARILEPGEFTSLRDITQRERPIPDGIRAIGGKSEGHDIRVQSLRAKADVWTLDRFKGWLNDNGYKYKVLTPATGKDTGKALLWFDVPGDPTCLIEPPGAELVADQASGPVLLQVCGKTVTAASFPGMAFEAAQKWARDCPEITGFGVVPRLQHVIAEGKALLAGPEAEDWPGTIEGYSAIYGVVDPEGDRFIKGCFARSIIERVPAGHVKLMLKHFAWGGDITDAIGVCVEAREDDIGLWSKFLFSATAQAQETRIKATEGIVDKFSVGFKPLREQITRVDDEESVNDIHEAIWLETTLTLQPVNEQATVLLAKSLTAKARNAGNEAEAAEIIGRLRTAIDEAVASVGTGAGKSGATAQPNRANTAQMRRELDLVTMR